MTTSRDPRDARRRRGADYVYVNQDGTVRELSPAERADIETEYLPGDGARPYVKRSYETLDGWGSVSGFLLRRHVPRGVAVEAVNANYDAALKELGLDRSDPLGAAHAARDNITTNSDGTVTISPNPELPGQERLERARQYMLAEQRRREALGKS